MKAVRSRTFWLVGLLCLGIVLVAYISLNVLHVQNSLRSPTVPKSRQATETAGPVATATSVAQTTQTQQAQVTETQQPLPTATATPEVNQFAGSMILTTVMCSSSGNGCPQSTSSSFKTQGPFSLLWACSNNDVSPNLNATIQIQVFNGAGRQVDVLSGTCTGKTPSQGIILEDLPPDTYTLTIGETTGPSWVVFALE
ncbi:MAG: hypothetical protein ACLQUY_27370 [Ktedonobacterales bacterium]